MQYGQTSNQHSEHPVLMENRRTRTIDSLHGVVPLEEKKGMVENKFNGSLIAPEKPTAPPVRAASVKYRGKDEVPQFEKAKQETGAKSIKPEYTYWDEREARAKVKSAPVATHEPMPPPLHTVSVKYNSKDEEQRFEKVKQETAAKDNKPECTSLDEIAAKAKVKSAPKLTHCVLLLFSCVDVHCLGSLLDGGIPFMTAGKPYMGYVVHRHL